MIMTLSMLAQAAAEPVGPVDGDFVLKLVAIVIAGVGGLFAGRKMKESEIQRREIHPNPLPVMEHREPTWAEVSALERRMETVEEDIKKLREEQNAQYRVLMAQGEERMGKILQAVRESANRIYEKLDKTTKDMRDEMQKADGETREDVKDVSNRVARLEGRSLKS